MPVFTLLLGIALILLGAALMPTLGPVMLIASFAGGWLVGTALAEMIYY